MVHEEFDLNECIEWINEHQFKNVCLYFLPEFFPISSQIVLKLQKHYLSKCEINFLVNVTCSTGPDSLLFRCQDNQQAIDGVIYFGCDCLCPERYSQTLPILFVSMSDSDENLLQYIDDCLHQHPILQEQNVLFVSDLTYSNVLRKYLKDKLKTHSNWNHGMLSKPNKTNFYFTMRFEDVQDDLIEHYPYKLKQNWSDYDWVIFVGNCQKLESIISCKQGMLQINPYKRTSQLIDSQKEFRKRVSLIEKFKTQHLSQIGIILYEFKNDQNCRVSKYLNESKHLCKRIGKQIRPYFITLNQSDYESRLGNFGQINGFVMITGCSCDWNVAQCLAKYLYPVIFWKEFLIASSKRSVIYGGIEWNKDLPEEQDLEDDDGDETIKDNDSMKQLIEQGVFKRPTDSWYGLVVDAGESIKPTNIQQGRKGIASSYHNEQDLF